MLPFKQCLPGRRHRRCVCAYPCIHMYVCIYCYIYIYMQLAVISSGKLQETIGASPFQGLDSLRTQRGNFFASICYLICGLWRVHLSVINYLPVTDDLLQKVISTSVQQMLKHILILRVFLVSKDTSAIQGQAQGRKQGETQNCWTKTQGSWAAVGLQV